MTAVQWLIDVYNTQGRIFSSQFEQALQMEKEQHGKTWDESIDNYESRGLVKFKALADFDQYYNETIKP